jgi:AraC-like DNA-binding protein
MDLVCEQRLSESPFVQRVWRSTSNEAGAFTSVANSQWGMVISHVEGKTTFTVRGPETKATAAYCPPDAEFIGIQFKAGAVMPILPAQRLMDRSDVNLPDANKQTFWLHGAAWQAFTFENADTFVDRLVRDGLLVQEKAVDAALQGRLEDWSLRTVQRRFLRATGITQGTLLQIKRARYATTLLRQGMAILDVAYQAGYADQPHLTRSLKHFIGQTPAQLTNPHNPQRLSFLFDPLPDWDGVIPIV